MPIPKFEHPLIAVLGPTASGKTALALALAERFRGEIVSCDSVAVYRGMDRGTAKPSSQERARISHQLIDVTEPDQPYTAGDYSRSARAALREITGRGALPIISGGTGLYLRALIDGLAPAPRRDEALRTRLKRSSERHGASWLHRLLTRMDSVSAARIHPHDEPKLIRAIEVSLAARRPISEIISAGREPLTGFHILRLGLEPERKALYARINARAAAMFKQGLVEETRSLLARYGPVAAMGALGYLQAASFLRGEITETEAIANAQQGHRNFAKRQLTWFRREPDVLWLQGFGDEQRVQSSAIVAVETLLHTRS